MKPLFVQYMGDVAMIFIRILLNIFFLGNGNGELWWWYDLRDDEIVDVDLNLPAYDYWPS